MVASHDVTARGVAFAFAFAATQVGCGLFAGLDDFGNRPEDMSSSATSMTSTTTASSASTSTSSGGEGGSGGSGGSASGSTSSSGGGGAAPCSDETCPAGTCDDDDVCRGALQWFLHGHDVDDGANQEFSAIMADGTDVVLAGLYQLSLELGDESFLTLDPFGEMFMARVNDEGTVTVPLDLPATGVMRPDDLVLLPDHDVGVVGAFTDEITFPDATDTTPDGFLRAYYARLDEGLNGVTRTTFGPATNPGTAALLRASLGSDGLLLGAGEIGTTSNTDIATMTIGDCEPVGAGVGRTVSFFVSLDPATLACAGVARIHGDGHPEAVAHLGDDGANYLVSSCGPDGCLFDDTTISDGRGPCVVRTNAMLDAEGAEYFCLEEDATPWAHASDAALVDGDVVITGYGFASFRQAPRISRITFDPEPLALWTTEIGNGQEGDFADVANRIAVHPDGRLRVLVSYSGTIELGRPHGNLVSTGKQDTAILTLDPADGTILAVRNIGGGGDVFLTSIAIGGDGRVCVAGKFEGEIDLGAGPFDATGGFDAIAACFADDLAE